MENFFFEKFFQKSFYGDGRILTFFILGIMYNGNETSVTNYDMGKGRENNET